MVYHFNFNFIWKYFIDKLAWGLALSLELAVVCIAVGALIGLIGALIHTDGPRWARALVAAYVEFIRNVPLILLVYLVFYGIPTVGGFSYGPTTSFIVTLSIYAGAYLVEVFRAGLDAVPQGAARCRQGDRPDALAAPGPCAAADHVPRRAAVARATPSSRCSRTPRSPA